MDPEKMGKDELSDMKVIMDIFLEVIKPANEYAKDKSLSKAKTQIGKMKTRNRPVELDRWMKHFEGRTQYGSLFARQVAHNNISEEIVAAHASITGEIIKRAEKQKQQEGKTTREAEDQSIHWLVGEIKKSAPKESDRLITTIETVQSDLKTFENLKREVHRGNSEDSETWQEKKESLEKNIQDRTVRLKSLETAVKKMEPSPFKQLCAALFGKKEIIEYSRQLQVVKSKLQREKKALAGLEEKMGRKLKK